MICVFSGLEGPELSQPWCQVMPISLRGSSRSLESALTVSSCSLVEAVWVLTGIACGRAIGSKVHRDFG